MAEETKQIDRVAALANRLRLLQIDYADQAEDVRRGYLTEEVRRVLTMVAPEDRQAFLSEFQGRFPAWENQVDLKAQNQAAASATDQRESNDPALLIEKLIALCKSLAEPARLEISNRLKAAGLAPAGNQDWPQQPLSELRAKLQLTAGERIDAGRGLELVAQLTEFATNLDKVAWSTWRALAPNSVHRRTTPLQTTLSRFAVGDSAIGREQLVCELKLLRQLTGALVATLSQTGRIAIQHFRSIAPEEIKLLVGPKGFSRETAYWRKYEELAGSMDVPSIDEAIRAGLVAFAEPLIQGPK